MNSKQEELVFKLSTQSVGAPFIFEPDNYKKGSAQREPADLVWACNDVCVLLYMKEKKKNADTDINVAKNRQKKLIDDNLIQAEGWLKEWKSNKNLIGKNNFQNFNIKYGDFRYCIIIVIIDYGPEMWGFHGSFQEEHNIDVCITLSQETFELITNLDCTLIDIVKILLMLKNSINKGLIISASQLIKDYYSSAFKKCGESYELYTKDDTRRFNAADRYLKDIRSLYNLNVKDVNNSTSFAIASIFNDIDIEDFLLLRKNLTKILNECGRDYRLYKVGYIKLKKYIVIMSVYGMGNWKLATEPAMRLMKELSNDSGIVLLNCETQYGLGITVFEPRLNKSDTYLILEKNISK